MFGWIHNCFGTDEKSKFERARLDCTYPDWRQPSPLSIEVLLEALDGKDEETPEEEALQSIFTHLEREEQVKSAPYLLKNILILDRASSQHLGLRKIGSYNNAQLLNLDPRISPTMPAIRDLITMYYSFVKEKAKCWGTQARELANPTTRAAFLKGLSPAGLLTEINTCFKVQNLVLGLSEKFKAGNKSLELIQAIFCSLLRTYLYCYAIVSMAAKEFASRIPELSQYDLQYLEKLATFLMNQYTRNFLIFIDANKTIAPFKAIKYNELHIIDQKLINIISTQIDKLKDQNAHQIHFPEFDSGDFTQYDPNEDSSNSDACSGDSDEDKPAHKIKLEIDLTKSMRDMNSFFKHTNLYHQDFSVEEEEDNSTPKAKPKKKFGLKSKLSLYGGLNEDRPRTFSISSSQYFERSEWDKWANIYSDNIAQLGTVEVDHQVPASA